MIDRCKELERTQCSAAALKDVCIQSIVTEHLINYAEFLFGDATQNNANEMAGNNFLIIVLS